MGINFAGEGIVRKEDCYSELPPCLCGFINNTFHSIASRIEKDLE